VSTTSLVQVKHRISIKKLVRHYRLPTIDYREARDCECYYLLQEVFFHIFKEKLLNLFTRGDIDDRRDGANTCLRNINIK